MKGLGLNSYANLTTILFNFIVMFTAQLTFELLGTAATGTWPTYFEFYKCILGSLASTFIFYGINKKKHEGEKK
ncbi:hypothetical protein KAR91_45880 [Candidatus Pacearchaeota archaeon]|nr:hypothetical protein [Candidatus Pacearchaeota archaeon]